MPEAVSLLKPRSMTEMVNMVVTREQFVFNLVFPNLKQHFSDTVDIPIKKGKRKLAKPSRKTSQAGVVTKDGAEIKTMKLPHIREKMLSTAATALTSAAQGGIYLGKSQKQAYALDIAENQAILKERAETTIEFMACQALRGAISLSGKDISVDIDFGFDNSHLPVKSGTAKWNSTAPNITSDLRTWKRKILKDFGVSPTVCIMGSTAADAFVSDEKVMKALNNLNYKAGVLNLESTSNYIGRYLGIDFYEYQNTYIDDADAEQEMYSVHDITLFAPNKDFTRNFAAIVDDEAGLNPVPFFSKSYPEKDPSGTWVLVETNPLPAVSNPNAILTATVTS